jgi:hypothetical protein
MVEDQSQQVKQVYFYGRIFHLVQLKFKLPLTFSTFSQTLDQAILAEVHQNQATVHQAIVARHTKTHDLPSERERMW